MLAHLVGTPYLPVVDAGLLYVEEIAEEPYADRAPLPPAPPCGNPRAAGARSCWATSPTASPRNPARYPYAMDEVVETVRAIVPCPVLAGLPFGHVARKLTLPFGTDALLSLGADRYTLAWPGLART